MKNDDDALKLLDRQSEALLEEALLAAYAPTEIDPKLNELLISQALEDPLAPANPEEAADSRRLAEALEGQGFHPDQELVESLRLATQPETLPNNLNERLANEALRRAKPSRTVVYVTFGAATAMMAAAASILLFMQSTGMQGVASQAELKLIQQRSTAALFHEKFDAKQTSKRIDKIARARSRDLRKNRYAMWGLR